MIQSQGETFPTQFSFCITLCYLDQTRHCWLEDSREPQHLHGHLPGPVLRVGEGDSTQDRDCHDQVCVVTNVTKIKMKVINSSNSRDEGRFTCIATNKAGESRRSVKLVVKVRGT